MVIMSPSNKSQPYQPPEHKPNSLKASSRSICRPVVLKIHILMIHQYLEQVGTNSLYLLLSFPEFRISDFGFRKPSRMSTRSLSQPAGQHSVFSHQVTPSIVASQNHSLVFSSVDRPPFLFAPNGFARLDPWRLINHDIPQR